MPVAYPNLNLLRGLAALSVLVYHVIELSAWESFPRDWPALWFRIGWLGVDLFFVISGFVIALSALSAWHRHGSAFRASFAWRRIARIVPLYLLTAVVFLVLHRQDLLQADTRVLAVHALTHLTFTHPWFVQTHGSINGPNWSVGIEMQFYVLMLFVTPWLARARWWQILGGTFGLAWLARAVGFVWTQGRDTFEVFVYTSQMPSMLDEFGAGILLARLVVDHGEALRRLPWARWGAVVAAMALMVVMVRVGWAAYVTRGGYWTFPWMVIGWRSLVALACAGLVAVMVLLPQVSRAWPLRPLDYLGEISYGIYLWHLPVLMTLLGMSALRGSALLATTLGIVVALSALSWHVLERPCMRAAARRWGGQAQAVPARPADSAALPSDLPRTALPG